MEQTALDHVNMEVEKGEFIGIIGHTGSGKSTLIQHFNALLMPTCGRVLVDGVDTAQNKKELGEIRQKVGLVFQYPEHQLFEETVEDDVAYGPRNLRLSEDEVMARVKFALNTVNISYEAYKDRSPFELSGGQMRRVAIAGVLAMQPEVLVLDEPTAGLDPEGRRQLMEYVSSFHKNLGITIVLVTHNMEDVARLAGRMFVMDQGRIKMEGVPGEIFTQSEELMELGLGVPEISVLMRKLQKCGWDLPLNVYTVKEAKQEMLRAMTKKRDDTHV